MSDELLLFDFMELDTEEVALRRLKRREMREFSNPFAEIENAEFVKRYRLSKQLVTDLCEEIRPLFRKPIKSTDLSVEQKVLITLAFYATGSYQRPIGDIGAHSVAQQTVSAVIAEVTACIDSTPMRRKYILFPKNAEERNNTRTRFYQKFKIKGVLGCIDCTQIAIVRPTENEERYYCRKHYHSINVQLICNADMEITSVDASYGGATHDSFVWNAHPIKEYMENLNERTWLLGDSGYPLRRYMMTPIVNAVPGTPESFYTDVHVRTRNIIERTIGLLKARFRCLLVHRVMHYKPAVAASITNACVILHNICNRAKLSVPELSDEDLLREVQLQQVIPSADVGDASQLRQQGIDVRAQLVQQLWSGRSI